MYYSRHFFAAAMLAAATQAGKLEFMEKHHAQYYDHSYLEKAKALSDPHKDSEKKVAQNGAIDLEHIPNWMRAFYDDFKPESHGDSSTDLTADEMHSKQAYHAAGMHSPKASEDELYQQFVRQHHGSTSVEPVFKHRDLGFGQDLTVTPIDGQKKTISALRDDPYSMDYSGQT